MTTAIIKEEAERLAALYGIKDFKASSGFYDKFKKRDAVSSIVKHGDASCVDLAIVDDWKTRLVNIIDKYNPDDIYNVDETALFYQLLPNQTNGVKGQKCRNGKKAKFELRFY